MNLLIRFGLATVMMVGSGIVVEGGQMKISSSAFSQGGNIPSKFTCDGADTSPPLEIEGVPAEAKALALIVGDPDAPVGLFTHWLVWNIDPKTHSIAEGVAPSGTAGKNDFGKSAYGGPCPPSGTHRYYFKVFALDQQLSLKPGTRRKELDVAMKGHVIGQGELMGRYARHK
jgi:Raf kinase inhibitor-like YbhB/YbcL family protein